ncbi:hypothetical protein MRX96_035301 [Rhipicephalus microplus]
MVTRHSDGIKRQALGYGGHHQRNAVSSRGPTAVAAPHNGGKTGALRNLISKQPSPRDPPSQDQPSAGDIKSTDLSLGTSRSSSEPGSRAHTA